MVIWFCARFTAIHDKAIGDQNVARPFIGALAKHRGKVPSSETPAEVVVPAWPVPSPETLRKGLSKHYKVLEDKKGTSASRKIGSIEAAESSITCASVSARGYRDPKSWRDDNKYTQRGLAKDLWKRTEHCTLDCPHWKGHIRVDKESHEVSPLELTQEASGNPTSLQVRL
eukprot:1779262-Amphidinium_carterae.3